MKRIIIIGSRRRNELEDYDAVLEAFIRQYQVGDLIVSGGCSKGGDRFAEYISATYNIWMVVWPAKWRKNGYYNRAAGFERNTIIAQNGDVLIALVAPDRKGGTEDTIKKFIDFNPNGKIIILH